MSSGHRAAEGLAGFPDWLAAEASLRWHGPNGWETLPWERAEAYSGGVAMRVAHPAQDVEVTTVVQAANDTVNGGCEAAFVELTVRPLGGEARMSGVLLAMPVDPLLACVWKPHLAPMEGMTAGDKSFRSPAAIFEDDGRMTALVPDLRLLEHGREVPHVLNYTLVGHELTYGLCAYEETGHVYYRMAPRLQPLDRELRFGFYLVKWRKESGGSGAGFGRSRDFRRVERFLWERYAAGRMPAGGEDWAVELAPYVQYAYGWALDRWKDVVWQSFELDGARVGGAAFLVTARQKPGLGEEERWREPKSLWNQAWFCGLRTAYGLRRWGAWCNRSDWVAKADEALRFALAAPQTNGLFPGYYQAGEDGAWSSGRWYMSGPRRPEGHEAYVHLLDASWTCCWLLKWHEDFGLGEDQGVLSYVSAYVETLLGLQREDGSFPAWVRPDMLESSPYLVVSPEACVHAMLLCRMNRLAADSRYVPAAERAARFVAEHIVPAGRWDDFETYWSCSREWEGKRYGEPDSRSGLRHQCNFGMYWTAEAMKDLFVATGNREWLDIGEQVLAEASLYQAIWQPPFFPVPVIGGFGVMNSDDEWNDARQSLFALTYRDYGRLTGDERYATRAYAALRASFHMMYCPDNPEVKTLYERVHPAFDERDYGFHMENFNHHDGSERDGMGEFTIFDWGCGAAAASLAELLPR